MDDHEKDRYGVSWGEAKQSLKITKFFSSFNLDGITYSLNDTVYLLAGDGPPYIAKILSMHEKEKTREKCMMVRWFCRPCELPLRTAGVNFKEDSKEIFMMWGSGSKNVVSPASTIGKCKVVCTAPLNWNLPSPSEELVSGSDHIFSFAFDACNLQVASLKLVVKQFGVCYVTGIGVQTNEVKNEFAERPRNSVQSAIEPAARVTDYDRPRPLLSRRASDGPSQVGKSNGGYLTTAVKPGLQSVTRVVGSDRRAPQSVGIASDNPRLAIKSNRGNVRKPVEMHDLIAEAKKKMPRFDSSGPKSQSGTSEKPKVTDASLSALSEPHKNVSQVYKCNVTPKAEGIESGESEMKGKRMQDPRGAPTLPVSPTYKSNVIQNIVGVELVHNELTGKQVHDSEQDRRLSGVQKFSKLPWHKALEIAVEKGRTLLLKNLDPWFSSSEIEGMLTELLQVSCEARMLPPKDFSSYTSGETLVLFQSQLEAEKAYAKFTENVLIWSEDQRPVVASLACKKRHEINRFHGFLKLAKFNTSNAEYQQGKSGATSQCSQPNTVVFEMGTQWRLLQERHREAWNLAAKFGLAKGKKSKKDLECHRWAISKFEVGDLHCFFNQRLEMLFCHRIFVRNYTALFATCR